MKPSARAGLIAIKDRKPDWCRLERAREKELYKLELGTFKYL